MSLMVFFYERKIEKYNTSLEKMTYVKDSIKYKSDSLLLRCNKYDNILEKQQIKLDAVRELKDYIDSSQRRQLRSEIMYRSLIEIEELNK
jgi:hypothetical protein